MKTKVIKVGDYVEVTGGDSGGVISGEQGIVVESGNQMSIRVIFPARTDYFEDNNWLVMAKQVKLLYRPRV